MGLLDFAELLGVDRTTAQVWLRQGMPAVRRRRGHRGAHEIEVGAAVRWLRARDGTQCEERLAAARANPEADTARTKKLAAEARIAEANACEREGELVPADQVEARWGQMALACRERMLSLPGVIVQRGLVEPDREEKIATLVHDALAELASRGNGHRGHA